MGVTPSFPLRSAARRARDPRQPHAPPLRATAREGITIQHVRKEYTTTRGSVVALSGVDASVGEGEFVAVVGPSGCGKSTLLKILAGLVPVTSGEASVRGTVVDGPRRDVGVAFQTPTLFPWRTVLENTLLGRVLVLAALLLAWEGVVRVLHVPAFILPPPSSVAAALHRGIASGVYLHHVWITLTEALLGFVAGSAVAFVLGATLAASPRTERLVYPYVIMFQSTRTVLDALLVAAAADARVEVREGFTVEEILVEDGRVAGIKGRSSGGEAVVERAQVVVGADGRQSLVAAAVRPEQYNERPPIFAGYYTYWSGLAMDGRFENYLRPHRGFGAAPTHDGLTLVIAGWPHADFEANKRDIEGNYLKVLELVPEFAERLRGAKREARLAGATVPNYFRKPYGPGWVLVGDAGYNKDPITAQGITDAFRDAERCAAALDESFTGARSFDDAMSDYQRARDEHVLPMFEFTCRVARLEPPPPEVQQLLRAAAGNQQAMDRFAQMNAGTISPAEFFAPDSIRAIRSAAHAARRGSPDVQPAHEP